MWSSGTYHDAVVSYWSVCWGEPKSDQTCTQANILPVFPLTSARERRWLNHCHSMGSPDISKSCFVRLLKKRGSGLQPYTPVVLISTGLKLFLLGGNYIVDVYQPLMLQCLSAGFPHNIESIKKVLNFKLGFQDHQKVLKLGKM